MASSSPAVHASQPPHFIDPRRAGEYPVFLGESLKNSAKTTQGLLNIRYNWKPRSGFEDNVSNLTRSNDNYRLVVQNDHSDETDVPWVYSGRDNERFLSNLDDENSTLALVFDKSRSCFVLESMSSALDLNVISAPGKPSEEIRRLPKLPKHSSKSNKATEAAGLTPSEVADDEEPDSSNPYDFRHFLSEAREISEKASQQHTGARTPLTGGLTPLGGLASPATGGGRFLATTPQFHASSGPKATQKKSLATETTKSNKQATTTKSKPQLSDRKGPKSNPQPLSKERISDSDDEVSDAIPIVRPKPVAPHSSRGHTRNTSANLGRSPHIVVNDGDLEIDMGSPPPEARRRGRIDPEAFRSHTGTPQMGRSSNTQRPIDDEDIIMKDIIQNDEANDGVTPPGAEIDDDVEELELGSPRTNRASVSAPNSSSIIEIPNADVENAPTPPKATVILDDDDDEDLLEAELAAALEEEDEQENATRHHERSVGLGISGASQSHRPPLDDDESEISEEE